MSSVQSLQRIAMDILLQKVLPSIPKFVPYHPIASAPVGLRRQLLDDIMSSAEEGARIAGAVEILIREGGFDTFEFTVYGRYVEHLEFDGKSAQEFVDVLLRHGNHFRQLYVDPDWHFWYRKQINKVVKLFKRVPNLLHLTLTSAADDLLVTVLNHCPLLQVLKVEESIPNLFLRNQEFSHSYENLQELELKEQLRLSEVIRVFPNLKTLACPILELDEKAPSLESLRVWVDFHFYHQVVDLDDERWYYSDQHVAVEEYHRMAKCLPNLKSLSMPVCKRMGNMKFLADFRSLRSMTFTLYHCWNLQYRQLVVVLPKLSGLQELTLSCIGYLDLYKIAKDCPNLSRLQLDNLNLMKVMNLTYTGKDQEFDVIFVHLRVVIIKLFMTPKIDKRAYDYLVELKNRRNVRVDLEILKKLRKGKKRYALLQN